MERSRFLAAVAALFGAPALAKAAQCEADLIVTGATIHSVDPRVPNPEAFAVRGGRFSFVGSRAGALAQRGVRTHLVDLRGKTVLPGLIDAHLHLTGTGLVLHEVELFHAASFDDVLARTVAFARTSPDTWVLGDGWDQNLWLGKAFPTHDRLSAALPNRPVVLTRVDGHAVLANAKAMELAGVTKATADPPGGRILRDADGTPTGLFVDNAVELVTRAVPAPSPAQLVRAVRSAVAECNRYGVTTVADPGANAAMIAAYEELLGQHAFTLRAYVMLSDERDLVARYLARGPQSASYDGRLWIRTVKLFADGALGSRGAALLEPYGDDPKNTGLMRTTQAHVQDVCERALRAGFQVCTHAIGDRGNRMVLDAYEAALRRVPSRDHRLRVEHAQVLSPQDVPRFARLGVIPSMQTTHQISDMGWAQARLGPDRVRGAYAWRSLLDTGVIIPNGTDSPVEPVNSLRTFHAAISRQNEQNQPPGGWFPNQRMTRDEALKSMTIWAAHANFQEPVLGSISPGKYADFVVLDRDVMAVPAEEIMGSTFLATYLGGKAVYEAGRSIARDPMRGRSWRRMRGGCCQA